MAEAPDAIWKLWEDIKAAWGGPGLQDEALSGIVHGPNDTPGFHWSRNELAAAGALGDYSLQTSRDRAGALAHPDAASALDVHFGPEGMKTVTRRLIASAQDPDDHRLDCLYEFCGTTNGLSPHPFTVDTGTDDPDNTQGWDDTHVTHVHLSIHRDVCTDYDAIKAVADVIGGQDTATPAATSSSLEEDFMFMIQNDKDQGGNGGIGLVMAAGLKPIKNTRAVAEYTRLGIPGPALVSPDEFNSYPRVGH